MCKFSILSVLRNNCCKRVVIFVVMLSFQGCISTVSYKYSSVGLDDPSEKQEKKTISYKFERTTSVSATGTFDRNNCSTHLIGAWAEPQGEATALRQFRRSFSPLASSMHADGFVTRSDADITLDIMQQNSWNSLTLLGAFVSGFFLTLIPCVGDDNYTLYVVARDRYGNEKEYQLTSSIETVVWAPFIFAIPFSGLPVDKINEGTQHNWDELFSRMRSDGFFDVHEGGGAHPCIRERIPAGQLVLDGSGSGFAVSTNGHIVTNWHVVKDSSKVEVVDCAGKSYVAHIESVDMRTDLALLKIDSETTPLHIRNGNSVKLGEDVFVLGYPQPSVQGKSLKVTKGVVSSMNGMHDDPCEYQIDAAIQPGNSGGPVIDSDGAVIGVTVSSLNKVKFLKEKSAIPENVNYCVKSSYLTAFLISDQGFSCSVDLLSAGNGCEKSIEDARDGCYLIMTYSYSK